MSFGATSGFTDDGPAVIAVVDYAIRRGMLALVLSSGSATLVRNDGPIFTTLQGVVDRIPLDYPQEMSDIISAQPTVLVDREIAMAWAPYDLLKQDGKWVISGLADNSRVSDA
ncbi:hypothetical protein B0H14DRAFT_2732320 [Mycena olivaceomarginata]|nr:hypothetical protein B0H14DRAFT_2732320 [Mycena olivaceomarginata]